MSIDPNVVHDLLQRARRRGATASDILFADQASFDVEVRLGDIENVQHAHRKRLGLRLFFGQSSATTSTSDLSAASLQQLLDDTCARAMAADPFAGLPSPDETIATIPELQLWDEALPHLPVETRTRMARDAEQAAMTYDPRITNSEGGEYGSSTSSVLYANSHGFLGQYRASSAQLSVAPIASDANGMQRDYWYSRARHLSHLEMPATIGEEAARRALRRLGARKVPTQNVPVVFAPTPAAGLLGHLCTAISGPSLYRGASFLVDHLHERIASAHVTIYDDGTMPTALSSKPFDGEGLPTRRTTVVENGVLKSYLLNTYTARKLGMRSTGNASRSAGASPGVNPTNFYLKPGDHTPESIIASISNGLYVTGLIGYGVNLVTGNYSRGASGIWIENGELTYPVEEITIAGNLRHILAGIDMVGNDLVMTRKISSPTLKIGSMTVAGN